MKIKLAFPAYWGKILLLLIFLLALVIRFDRLGQNPPALNWDEVSHGVNAYSILLTGKDEWGMKLPLIFRAFGDYKLPLYIYLSTLPIALFGLTALGVRFVSAFAGSLAVVGIYLLVNQLFPEGIKLGRRQLGLGLVAALVLALFPWHFFLSRVALEANLSLTLIIWGFALLLYPKNWTRLVGLVLLGFSLHTYNSARVFTPLMLLATLGIFGRRVKLNWGWLLGGLFFLASIGLVAAQVKTGVGLARYEKLSILSPAKVYELGQKRLESTLPSPLPRLIYNRPVYFATTVGKNYLNYFSPGFLYQTQGAQYQFAIPGVNLLGLPVLIFALFGGVIVLKKNHQREAQFIGAWLLLAPLPAALTLDPPQSLRPLYLIAAAAILAAIGIGGYLVMFTSREKLKVTMLAIVVLILGLAFGRYWLNYWQVYQPQYSFAWQDGYRQMWQYVFEQEKKNNYDSIIVTKRLGEPHIFLAFYKPLRPEALWPGGDNIRFAQSDWYWTDKLGKYYFANDWDITPLTKESIKLESGSRIPIDKTLVVASPGQLPQSTTKIKEITDLSGTIIFEIGERR